MSRDIEARTVKPPVLRRAVAAFVVVAVAALTIHFVIGLVVTVFWVALVFAAIAAVLWAVNTLL